MKIILVSTPDKFKSEVGIVVDLLENGLEVFHLRKPKFSKRKTIEYLRKIPREFHDRIVLHSHFKLAVRYKLKGIHLSKKDRAPGFEAGLKLWWFRVRHRKLQITTSFHSILSLLEDDRKYDYVILSPVFNSTSKLGFDTSFGEEQLRKTLMKSPQTVFALGGVVPEKVDEMRRIGFHGAAISGIIWEADENEDKIEAFQNFKAVVEGRKSVLPKIEIKPVKIDLKRD